jgi:hypothetical protein
MGGGPDDLIDLQARRDELARQAEEKFEAQATRYSVSFFSDGDVELELVHADGTKVALVMHQFAARQMGKRLLIAVQKARRWQQTRSTES